MAAWQTLVTFQWATMLMARHDDLDLLLVRRSEFAPAVVLYALMSCNAERGSIGTASRSQIELMAVAKS